MFKYIILCLCVSLNVALCDLNKEEGADCEWEDLKGQCVKDTRCLTTLDDASPKHPVCSERDGEAIICCTDCELVNDTKNAVFSPTGRLYWKDGQKARDNCLQYLKDLPYQCKQDGYYSGIHRELDGEKKCYKYGVWAVGGPPPKGQTPSAKYPYQVLLGYGDDISTAVWHAEGFIISDKYIVTAAHVINLYPALPMKFIAVGVKNRLDPPESWQIHKVKSLIAHPEYEKLQIYHDIALIESETPIQFDINVLPACLHVDEGVAAEKAISATWTSLEKGTRRDQFVNTIQTIKLEAYSEEECKSFVVPNRLRKKGYDHATQMCYGSLDKAKPHEICKSLSGDALMVDTQFSRCVYTAVGVTSFGFDCSSDKPTIFTRVAHYVPWIESIVWP